MSERIPPVSVGERIRVEIVNKSDEIKYPHTRVAKVKGYVVFVADCDAELGEEVDIVMKEVNSNYGRATLDDNN